MQVNILRDEKAAFIAYFLHYVSSRSKSLKGRALPNDYEEQQAHPYLVH